MIIVFCLLCGLTACGNKKSENKNTEADKGSESAVPESATFSGKAAKSPSPDWVKNLAQAKDAGQLFVICGPRTSNPCISIHKTVEYV